MSDDTAATVNTFSFLPKLLPTGANWTAFRIRFEAVMQAEGLWGHFDGTPCRAPAPRRDISPHYKERDDVCPTRTRWDMEESKATMFLVHCITDSTLLRIRSKSLLKDRWDLVVAEYTQKEDLIRIELCARFKELRFPDNGNVKEFCEVVKAKREELASCGVLVDESYCHSIISSLPPNLSDFASILLGNARLLTTTQKVDLDILFALIVKESERYATNNLRRFKEEDKKEAQVNLTTGSKEADESKGEAGVTSLEAESKASHIPNLKPGNIVEEKKEAVTKSSPWDKTSDDTDPACDQWTHLANKETTCATQKIKKKSDRGQQRSGGEGLFREMSTTTQEKAPFGWGFMECENKGKDPSLEKRSD